MVMGGGLYIARTTVRIITRTDKYNAFCDTCLGKHIWGFKHLRGILGLIWSGRPDSNWP